MNCYASSEFLRNYVPLWVLFPRWGMKGVISKLNWCWNKVTKKCKQNECLLLWAYLKYNLEAFLCIMDLQNEHNLFLSNIYNVIPICTLQCECVSAKTSSFTEEQVSRNLRIHQSYFSFFFRKHFLTNTTYTFFRPAGFRSIINESKPNKKEWPL